MKWRHDVRMCARMTPDRLARLRQRSPEERLASSHYSRAKRLHGGQPNGYWTAAQWKQLCERADWRCAYCRVPTTRLSPDHIQALALGGTNDFSNIAPICPDCQRHKAARPLWDQFRPDEYEDLMRWLHPEVPQELWATRRSPQWEFPPERHAARPARETPTGATTRDCRERERRVAVDGLSRRSVWTRLWPALGGSAFVARS